VGNGRGNDRHPDQTLTSCCASFFSMHEARCLDYFCLRSSHKIRSLDAFTHASKARTATINMNASPPFRTGLAAWQPVKPCSFFHALVQPRQAEGTAHILHPCN
jgi:hypothetical protein